MPSNTDRRLVRSDLLRIIAIPIRRSMTFVGDDQARACADPVLRKLKAAGIRILQPRTKR